MYYIPLCVNTVKLSDNKHLKNIKIFKIINNLKT